MTGISVRGAVTTISHNMRDTASLGSAGAVSRRMAASAGITANATAEPTRHAAHPPGRPIRAKSAVKRGSDLKGSHAGRSRMDGLKRAS